MGTAATNGLLDNPAFCRVESVCRDLPRLKSGESAYEFQARYVCIKLCVQGARPGGAVLWAHVLAAHLCTSVPRLTKGA